MKGDETAVPQFEFTAEQERDFAPLQTLIDADGFFSYGKHAGKHITDVPGDYLASRVVYQVAEAIAMQNELNRRDCHDFLLVLLDEPEYEPILSDYVNQQ